MRAAFRVATNAVRPAASASAASSSSSSSSSTVASTSSLLNNGLRSHIFQSSSSPQPGSFSLSSQILRHGYASKAGGNSTTRPPTPPPSSASSSSSSGKQVSKDPNSASQPADPDRHKEAAVNNNPAEQSTDAVSPEAPSLTSASSPTDSTTSATASETEETLTTPIPSRSTSTEIAPASSLASKYLDATEIPMSAEEARRTNARAKGSKHSLSSIEKKRRLYGRIALITTFVGAGAVAWHMGRDWENEREKLRLGRDVTVEEGLTGRWQRGQARLKDTLDYFNKPAWDPLLPDPLPAPHQKPYTLILSLDDLLIHSSWDREHGWRTAKRPGVDYFLAYLSQFYEIVLFTSQPNYTAIPIVEKLDPHMIYILYKLFRESTRYYNKTIVKDLSYLGRDLSKVVMLDTNPEHFQLQPENAYKMPKWEGRRDDTDLVGMIPFLEAIAIYQIPDVRPVLKNYADKHIPTAWAEVEREQKRQLIKEWEAEQEKKKGKLSGGGFGSLFGLGGSSSGAIAAGPPKTRLEQERELYQKAYLEEQKYWAEHKGEIEKAMEEERQKQMQQMNSSVLNFFMASTGLQPPPQPEGTSSPEASSVQPTASPVSK